jgi:adenosylcobyric acid synthase
VFERLADQVEQCFEPAWLRRSVDRVRAGR